MNLIYNYRNSGNLNFKKIFKKNSIFIKKFGFLEKYFSRKSFFRNLFFPEILKFFPHTHKKCFYWGLKKIIKINFFKKLLKITLKNLFFLKIFKVFLKIFKVF